MPVNFDVHLVMDNYGTHKNPAVKAWCAHHPRFHPHCSPTSASCLNRVERWFATLTERQICRGIHRSSAKFEEALRAYFDRNNRNPASFVWTKIADDILDSSKRFGVRTSNSGRQYGAGTAHERTRSIVYLE